MYMTKAGTCSRFFRFENFSVLFLVSCNCKGKVQVFPVHCTIFMRNLLFGNQLVVKDSRHMAFHFIKLAWPAGPRAGTWGSKFVERKEGWEDFAAPPPKRLKCRR